MTNFHGQFCWHELMTDDLEAAKAFYGHVVGWDVQQAPVTGKPYFLFTTSAGPVGGVMDLPEECRQVGIPPRWNGYVAVEDVDKTANLSERLGGTIRVLPTDIPGVGRFSVISDPQGAAIALFKMTPSCSGQSSEMSTPGAVGWNELHTTDWHQAFDFYHQLFGWEKGEALDMGEMGTYQLFLAGEKASGGMFNKPPAEPKPFWLFYFNVDDIDAAALRATQSGAHIITGPTPVPGGGWIIQARDPQGTMFALHGMRPQ